jgi:hypothetical protein
MIALVLSVVGLGVFFGLQHLGYNELHELRRMARRTWEQKTIIYNNLAIRRAEVELARAKTVNDIALILKAAFEGNDYDGFEITYTLESTASYTSRMMPPLQYDWRREEGNRNKGWEVRLDLFSKRGEVRGCFSIHRSYTESSLRSDIDCFTKEFASALSLALQRVGESQVPSIGITGLAENRPADIASVA